MVNSSDHPCTAAPPAPKSSNVAFLIETCPKQQWQFMGWAKKWSTETPKIRTFWILCTLEMNIAQNVHIRFWIWRFSWQPWVICRRLVASICSDYWFLHEKVAGQTFAKGSKNDQKIENSDKLIFDLISIRECLEDFKKVFLSFQMALRSYARTPQVGFFRRQHFCKCMKNEKIIKCIESIFLVRISIRKYIDDFKKL